jgi:hypothetical protein
MKTITEPIPKVLEHAFGSHAVEYHLRAWTDAGEGLFGTDQSDETWELVFLTIVFRNSARHIIRRQADRDQKRPR